MSTPRLKTALIACLAGALSLSPAGFALAQGHGDERGRDNDQRREAQQRDRGQDGRQDQRGGQGRNDGNDSRGNRDYRDNRGDGGYRGDRDQRGNGEHRYSDRGRGAGPNHNFYAGSRLPPAYRQRSYVVDDWRGHHLNAPPRGYHWVQSGPDYMLVAITTGVILSLLLSN